MRTAELLERLRAMSPDLIGGDAADEIERLLTEVERLRAQEPMDMALCERHSLVLRIGQPYRFFPTGDCESCATLAAAAREAYGDERAPRTPQPADAEGAGPTT